MSSWLGKYLERTRDGCFQHWGLSAHHDFVNFELMPVARQCEVTEFLIVHHLNPHGLLLRGLHAFDRSSARQAVEVVLRICQRRVEGCECE